MLGEDRDAALQAAQARGLAISSASEAVLRAIPTEQLRLTLEQLQLATDAPLPPFDAEVAVAGGIRPDVPEQRWVSLGIQPDVPISRGISPDLPEERRSWWKRLFGK